MSREIVLIRRLRSIVLLRRFYLLIFVLNHSTVVSMSLHCPDSLRLPYLIIVTATSFYLLSCAGYGGNSGEMPSCCEVDGRSNHAITGRQDLQPSAQTTQTLDTTAASPGAGLLRTPDFLQRSFSVFTSALVQSSSFDSKTCQALHRWLHQLHATTFEKIKLLRR